jgi:CheY-like chemotaxis protein
MARCRSQVSISSSYPPSSSPIFDFFAARYEPIEIPVNTSRRRMTLSNIEPTTPVDPPIGNVVLSVTDSGPGLSQEQQQALFRQGVQFNPNQLQAGQGSGLGLWISKEIVCLHHGTIRVTSAGLGCGSTFEVTFPVHLRDKPPIPLGTQSTRLIRPFSPPQSPLASDQVTPLPPNGSELVSNPESRARHVLVVDDAASNRKLVSRLLRTKGFLCHEAENGAECVDKVLAGEHPYEFILMDFEMPVLDGPSATRRLREKRCDLPIIGVTGNVLPEDKAFFLKQGANAVLTKPLNLSELLQVIDSTDGATPLSKV